MPAPLLVLGVIAAGTALLASSTEEAGPRIRASEPMIGRRPLPQGTQFDIRAFSGPAGVSGQARNNAIGLAVAAGVGALAYRWLSG